MRYGELLDFKGLKVFIRGFIKFSVVIGSTDIRTVESIFQAAGTEIEHMKWESYLQQQIEALLSI